MTTEENSNTSDSLFKHIFKWRLPLSKQTKHRANDTKGSRKDENLSDDVVKIAEGGFSKVYRVRDSNTGQHAVLKEMSITEWSDTVPSSIIREISLLREMNHPNIVRLLNVQQRNIIVNLVFENLDCDLHEFIHRNDFSANPLLIKSFMHQILSALAYCHAHKILHRDLKPRNVLVDVSNKIVKLADFGLARPFGEPDTIYTSNVGTCWYRAPELLLYSEEYTGQIDVWSLGCMFGEMVSGQCVFQGAGQDDELIAIYSVLGTPTKETWPEVATSRTLVPSQEYAAIDLKRIVPRLEPEGLDLFSRMLVLNPNKRITVEAALNHPYFKDLNSKGKP
ncbi:hypothetical protein L6164_018189 [Bauhinia variegata]|uniref:Uncharacterized protein n=1 Tax=Bauhinia variegata TaxID=167791 RepID=A0ACB9NF72_BAUVA|nr:hypothetical protein L6164_018189 [Bauhinia variegata]